MNRRSPSKAPYHRSSTRRKSNTSPYHCPWRTSRTSVTARPMPKSSTRRGVRGVPPGPSHIPKVYIIVRQYLLVRDRCDLADLDRAASTAKAPTIPDRARNAGTEAGRRTTRASCPKVRRGHEGSTAGDGRRASATPAPSTRAAGRTKDAAADPNRTTTTNWSTRRTSGRRSRRTPSTAAYSRPTS